MKIYVTRPLPRRAMDRLEEFPARIVVGKTRPGLPQLIRGARDADGLLCLLTDPISAPFVDACPKLKVISTVAVGTDNIDLEACRRRGIQVFNTPHVLTETTADLVWALLMAAARRLVEGDRMVRAGKFTGWALDLLLGVDLYGKTLGIIGPGRIGTAVARRAAGFAMRILTCGRNESPEPLLRESDFIVVTTPLTEQTRHMIGRAQFDLMKPTAVLVNVGRGAVVEERALVEALKKRKIFAAGLDVYEFEPNVSPALRKLDNVVLLPHIGSASIETRERMALSAVNQLVGALEKL